jgi:hypothetical protein
MVGEGIKSPNQIGTQAAFIDSWGRIEQSDASAAYLDR